MNIIAIIVRLAMLICAVIAMAGCVSLGSKSLYYGYDPQVREYQQDQSAFVEQERDPALSGDAMITAGYYSSVVAPMSQPWSDRLWAGTSWNSFYDPFWGNSFRSTIVPIGFAPSVSFGFGWRPWRRVPVAIVIGNSWWYDPFYDPWLYGGGIGIGFGFGPRAGFGYTPFWRNSWYAGCWNRGLAMTGFGGVRPWYYRPVAGTAFIGEVPRSFRSFGPDRGYGSQFDDTRGVRVRSTTTRVMPQNANGTPSNSFMGNSVPSGGARGRTWSGGNDASSSRQPSQSSVTDAPVRTPSNKHSSPAPYFKEKHSQQPVRSFDTPRSSQPKITTPRQGARSRGGGQ